MIGHKRPAEAMGLWRWPGSVGEHSGRREAEGATRGGAAGKANVGMSNDNAGENPARRKTKGS